MSHNGTLRTKRPQLSESIEKLDAMIDGLAGAIPGAVADSVREVLSAVLPEVVKAAVDRAVGELAASLAAAIPASVIGSPTVAGSPSPSSVRPGWASGLRDRLRAVVGAVRSGVRKVWTPARALLGVVALVRGSPRTATVAVLAGVVVGAGVSRLGPSSAAVVSGLAAGLLTLGGVWLAPFARLLVPAPEEIDLSAPGHASTRP